MSWPRLADRLRHGRHGALRALPGLESLRSQREAEWSTPGRNRSSLVGKASPEGVQLRDFLEGHLPDPQPGSEEPQSSLGAHASALCREAGRQEFVVSCARQSFKVYRHPCAWFSEHVSLCSSYIEPLL